MATYSISKTFPWQGQITNKVAQVCRMFGLTTEQLSEKSTTHNCQLQINKGDIVYITGPSGCGKTVLLGELEKSIPGPDKVNLARIELPNNEAVIDCIDGDFLTSLKLLSIAGLNDVFCVLSKPTNLSDGQKWRFRLAVALALQKKFIFADEFCCELDRITASVISYNINKFAKRTGTTFVLAASNDDVLADLVPDVLVVKELSGQTQVIYKKTQIKKKN